MSATEARHPLTARALSQIRDAPQGAGRHFVTPSGCNPSRNSAAVPALATRCVTHSTYPVPSPSKPRRQHASWQSVRLRPAILSQARADRPRPGVVPVARDHSFPARAILRSDVGGSEPPAPPNPLVLHRQDLEERMARAALNEDSTRGRVRFDLWTLRPPHAQAASSLSGELCAPFHRGRGGPGGWIILNGPELHLHGDVLVPDIGGWRRERMPSLPSGSAFELAIGPAKFCRPPRRRLTER